MNWRLREAIEPHDVKTTRQMRWDDFDNGELLKVAQQEFDVMLTTDANLYHQQKVADYDLSVIVLRAYKNSIQAIAPLMIQVLDLLDHINPKPITFTLTILYGRAISDEARAVRSQSAAISHRFQGRLDLGW
ncbi:MAG: hypothetical protein SF097_07530 [Acidobacteriota bacterium]|nr:hypothetical protein [Acidobacteriota bacterium]